MALAILRDLLSSPNSTNQDFVADREGEPVKPPPPESAHRSLPPRRGNLVSLLLFEIDWPAARANVLPA
jgi:hypothetical protein